jgi:hypothetical protein
MSNCWVNGSLFQLWTLRKTTLFRILSQRFDSFTRGPYGIHYHAHVFTFI